jgi:hypothetical protein
MVKNKINKHSGAFLDEQCGFRKERNSMDVTFTLKQISEEN